MQGSYRLDPEIVGRRHFQTFTEGHELDRKSKVAKQMIGRRLSQEEAKKLLGKFECSKLGADAICNKNIWIEGKSLWIAGAAGSSQ